MQHMEIVSSSLEFVTVKFSPIKCGTKQSPKNHNNNINFANQCAQIAPELIYRDVKIQIFLRGGGHAPRPPKIWQA
jgi:hypothetical protein